MVSNIKKNWYHSQAQGRAGLHSMLDLVLFFFFSIYLFIWLHQGLVAACEIFSCSMQDLVPWPQIKPRPPALGAWSLSHWATKELLQTCLQGALEARGSNREVCPSWGGSSRPLPFGTASPQFPLIARLLRLNMPLSYLESSVKHKLLVLPSPWVSCLGDLEEGPKSCGSNDDSLEDAAVADLWTTLGEPLLWVVRAEMRQDMQGSCGHCSLLRSLNSRKESIT